LIRSIHECGREHSSGIALHIAEENIPRVPAIAARIPDARNEW
jgi:hypothetical protein